MSKRIHDLAEQAREFTRKDTQYTENTWLIYEKKFAQLLMEDVEYIIDGMYIDVPLEQQVILLTVIEKIKKHFG